MSKKSSFKLIAFLLGVVLLGLFIQQIDLQLVAINLVKIGWQFLWLLLISGTAYLLATVAWFLCLPNRTSLSISKLFIYRLIGETLTVINPANIIVGESAKIYLLKKEDISYEEGITSILLSRILIMLSMVTLFLLLPIGFINQSLDLSAVWNYLLPISLLILVLLSLFYLLVHPALWLYHSIDYLANRYGYAFLKKWTPKVKQVNELLTQFYQDHKGRLIIAFWLSFFHWIMGAVEIYALLYLLGIKCTLWKAILMEVGITCFKSMGAFIPGQIGVEEYGNKLMLTLVGITGGGIWVVVSILRRTRQLFWLGLGIICCLFVYKRLDIIKTQTL